MQSFKVNSLYLESQIRQIKTNKKASLNNTDHQAVDRFYFVETP
jgi:hypothetical protein